jgi:hypothetical protein
VTVAVLNRETFALRDKQWNEITKYVKLPDEARLQIEAAVQMHSRSLSLWVKSPSKVKKPLIEISSTALKLARLLGRLSEQERIELLEADEGPFYRKRITLMIAEAEDLSKSCVSASKDLYKVSRPELLDRLVFTLDGILQEFTGRQASQEKDVLSFLTTVCGIADRKFGTASIVKAIQRVKAPGKKRTENNSNPPAESRQQ